MSDTLNVSLKRDQRSYMATLSVYLKSGLTSGVVIRGRCLIRGGPLYPWVIRRHQ